MRELLREIRMAFYNEKGDTAFDRLQKDMLIGFVIVILVGIIGGCWAWCAEASELPAVDVEVWECTRYLRIGPQLVRAEGCQSVTVTPSASPSPTPSPSPIPSPSPAPAVPTWPGSGPALEVPLAAGSWRISVEVQVGEIRCGQCDELVVKVGPRDSQFYARSQANRKLRWQRGEVRPWSHWDPGTRLGETPVVVSGQRVTVSWVELLDAPSVLWIGPDSAGRPPEEVLSIEGWTVTVSVGAVQP